MRNPTFVALVAFIAVSILFNRQAAWAQSSASSEAESRVSDSGKALVVGHPFSAIKYARRVRVLPDGKQQFLSNERYPIRIARDADGRLTMQIIDTAGLYPECDRLDILVPPICPSGAFLSSIR